jgi:hypothetical protein
VAANGNLPAFQRSCGFLIKALKCWWPDRLGFLHPELSNLILSLSKDQQSNAKRAENPPVSFVGFGKISTRPGAVVPCALPEQRA